MHDFFCEPQMEAHVKKVMNGEYDIPFHVKSPLILDIGANVGAFAVWATFRWPGARIECYEPHPETFKRLVENTQHYPQITCFNYGIGRPGTRLLYSGKNNCGEATLFGDLPGAGTQGFEVRIESSDILAKADIIKIDTEGAEIEILDQLYRSGKLPSAIMLEYHRVHDRRIIDEFLTKYYLVGSYFYALTSGVVKYMKSEFFPNVTVL